MVTQQQNPQSIEAGRRTPPARKPLSERGLLRLAGGLLTGGFLIFVLATQLLHPSGDENHHEVIFDKYAHSDVWVAAHYGQFAGVLIALGGFVVLYRALDLRGHIPVLARLALGASIATASIWAVLQAVDGVALKQAVDAWVSASAPEKAARFGDAEALRWTEWGLQSYFRLLMGLTLALFGVAVMRTALVARWLGAVATLGGVLYIATGVAVGHSGFEQPAGFQLLFVVFVVGVLVEGIRRRDAAEPGVA